MRVLVTGFGAFPGAHSNPSLAILSGIARQKARLSRLGITLETARLPVIYDGLRPALQECTSGGFDAILHLGLAGRRTALCVETRALNRANPLHPDAARRRAAQAVVPGGPAAMRARYPAARIVVAARSAGVATRCSIDAGDYVCNATLYHTLSSRFAPRAGFIHVPKPRDPARPTRRTRRPRPGVSDLTRAVLAAVVLMARDARSCSRPAL